MNIKRITIGGFVILLSLMNMPYSVNTQEPSWDKIPMSSWQYDLPNDMCYSIIDQTPYIITLEHPIANGTNEYRLTYISILGNLNTIVYYYSRDQYYYYDHKMVGTGKFTPKCYQAP